MSNSKILKDSIFASVNIEACPYTHFDKSRAIDSKTANTILQKMYNKIVLHIKTEGIKSKPFVKIPCRIATNIKNGIHLVNHPQHTLWKEFLNTLNNCKDCKITNLHTIPIYQHADDLQYHSVPCPINGITQERVGLAYRMNKLRRLTSPEMCQFHNILQNALNRIEYLHSVNEKPHIISKISINLINSPCWITIPNNQKQTGDNTPNNLITTSKAFHEIKTEAHCKYGISIEIRYGYYHNGLFTPCIVGDQSHKSTTNECFGYYILAESLNDETLQLPSPPEPK